MSSYLNFKLRLSAKNSHGNNQYVISENGDFNTNDLSPQDVWTIKNPSNDILKSDFAKIYKTRIYGVNNLKLFISKLTMDDL